MDGMLAILSMVAAVEFNKVRGVVGLLRGVSEEHVSGCVPKT
jgi:hypothetical protein